MASLFVAQAAIPYLIVEVRGGTATEYGIGFAILCAVYIFGNYVSGRWGRLIPRGRLIVWCGLGCLATSVAAVSTLGWDTVMLFLPAVGLSLFAAIAIAPVQSEAVSAQPACSGSASGLMTGMQMAIGAVVVQMVGFSHDGTPYPMFIALVACTAGAVAAYVCATLFQARPATSPA